MCDAPARVWDIVNKGRIAAGYDADLVLSTSISPRQSAIASKKPKPLVTVARRNPHPAGRSAPGVMAKKSFARARSTTRSWPRAISTTPRRLLENNLRSHLSLVISSFCQFWSVMSDPLFPVLLILRYMHILGAIALMGGTIFMRFALRPVVVRLAARNEGDRSRAGTQPLGQIRNAGDPVDTVERRHQLGLAVGTNTSPSLEWPRATTCLSA